MTASPENSHTTTSTDATPSPPQPPPDQPGKRPTRKRTPSSRSSIAETELRVRYVIEMILQGRRYSEIKQFFRTKYGIKYRQVGRYMASAREILREAIREEEDDLAAKHYAWLSDVVRNAEATARDKVAAIKEMNAMLGLHKPIKVAPTTPGGDQPYQPKAEIDVSQLTPEQVQALAEVRRLQRQSQ